MVVGPFSLSSTTNAWAEFDLFLDVEYPFDEVFWGVSTDGLNFDGYAVSPGPDGTTTGETTVPGFAHEVFSFKEIAGVVGAVAGVVRDPVRLRRDPGVRGRLRGQRRSSRRARPRRRSAASTPRPTARRE